MLNNILKYFLNRTDEVSFWIGSIGFLGEALLHIGHVSTLMLIFFLLVTFASDAQLASIAKIWGKSARDNLGN